MDGCYVWDELEDRLDEWMDYTVKWTAGLDIWMDDVSLDWMDWFNRTDGLHEWVGWIDRMAR